MPTIPTPDSGSPPNENAPVTPQPGPAALEPAAIPAKEDVTVDVAGVKHVPLPVLMAERAKRQAVEARAAQADQLEATLQQVRPLVEYVQAHPEVLQPRGGADQAATLAADPDVTRYAKLLSLYKPDGQLDLETAKEALAIADHRADQRSQAAVQPWAQASARDRSALNFQRATQLKDASGASPSPQNLQAVWQNLPVEYTADPQVASLLAAMALGLDRMSQPAPVPPPGQEPLVTEPSGGPGRGRVPMSTLEQAVAANRRITPEKWTELTKGHTQGHPTVLEDD